MSNILFCIVGALSGVAIGIGIGIRITTDRFTEED